MELPICCEKTDLYSDLHCHELTKQGTQSLAANKYIISINASLFLCVSTASCYTSNVNMHNELWVKYTEFLYG